MPSAVIARCRCHGASAIAKITAPPAPPTAISHATVRRGPNRSSAAPTGSCISAKAMNHSPDDRARSPGPAPT